MQEYGYNDEEILKEIRRISTTSPNLMQCYFCTRYDRATSYCSVTKMKMAPFIRGCNGKFFISREEEIVYKVKQELNEEKAECDKIENLLALLVTTLGSAQCFCEDLSTRLTKLRKKQKDSKQKSLLKKDLEMTDDVKFALSNIEEITESMEAQMQEYVEKIEQQYRMYIEPHVNRMFKKDGKWDVKKGDNYLNNQFEICRVIAKFVKGCIGNEENSSKVFKMLDELHNDFYYALTHQDLEHYKFKG